MSALAKLMILKGYSVSGSDLRYSAELEELGEWGAEIHLGSEPEAVKSADLVVFSGAIPATDPELLQAIASVLSSIVVTSSCSFVRAYRITDSNASIILSAPFQLLL